jgi:Domain of unknown function DUF29
MSKRAASSQRISIDRQLNDYGLMRKLFGGAGFSPRDHQVPVKPPVVVARAGPYPFHMSTRPAADLYEHDFFAWTQFQARALRRFARTRPNVPLDLKHLAEEVADLGKEQRNALRSWTVRIIEHLLLLELSPVAGPRRGWIDEIVGFRDEIEARLTPTLRRDLARQLPRLYDRAKRRLARKLELYGEADNVLPLPERSPYTLEQVLGDWWPGREEG